ncbi:hypothetical protein H8356DRAFT_1418095 [Neocallimastix lanati (nom. inval.)]|nr:hypothetical protein H8356DRAFT_1418095 [Neocallimastix sp. JGI-2020a]
MQFGEMQLSQNINIYKLKDYHRSEIQPWYIVLVLFDNLKSIFKERAFPKFNGMFFKSIKINISMRRTSMYCIIQYVEKDGTLQCLFKMYYYSIMSKKKMFYRILGNVNAKSKQPTEGKSQNGELRLNAILQDMFKNNTDLTEIKYCNVCHSLGTKDTCCDTSTKTLSISNQIVLTS